MNTVVNTKFEPPKEKKTPRQKSDPDNKMTDNKMTDNKMTLEICWNQLNYYKNR